MKTAPGKLIGAWPLAVCLALLNAHSPLAAPAPEPATSNAIPWSEIGAKAGAQYQGDGLSIVSTKRGAVLNCVFQKLEGEATAEGLWLTSTAAGAVNDRFRVLAASVSRILNERSAAVCEAPAAAATIHLTCCGWICDHSRAPLPNTGRVQVTDNRVRFIRSGVIEEYSVSMDGVRQDFIIERPPTTHHPSTINRHELRVELDVDGARVEATAHGARLVLENSGRKIAYSRLRVTDGTGKELPARMEAIGGSARLARTVRRPAGQIEHANNGSISAELARSGAIGETPMAATETVALPVSTEAALAIVVNDADAVYPVRIDPTFSDENWISMGGIPGANARVYAAATDASGNLYVGGDFTVIGKVFANRIAKWDGLLWSALGSGVNSTVYALAVSGSDVYVGGLFTTAGGNTANRIAKWNGSSWTTFGSGLSNMVHAIAVSGTNVYAGTLGGVTKWNGSAWTAFGLNGSIFALAVSGTNLYAGGSFQSIGQYSGQNIAKWIGTEWVPVGSSVNGTVYALAVSGSDLYVGGSFTAAGGNGATNIAKWNGSVWTPLGTGVNSEVYALVTSGSNVYAAGTFATAGGGTARFIAKWNGNTWAALSSGLSYQVWALAMSGNDLYVGGEFTGAGGAVANYVAKWSGNSWSAMPSGINNQVRAMAVSGIDLYAGGYFTSTGNRIAKWNGNSWSGLGSGISHDSLSFPSVRTLALLDSDLYAGGQFTRAGGNAATNVAKWNGSSWSALGSGIGFGFPDAVNALAVLGTNLYAGGNFTNSGGSPAVNIAKWNGSSWSSLGSGVYFVDFLGSLSGSVNALAVSGTNLYVGGDFTTAGGSPATNIAKWNGSSWSGVGLGIHERVYALAVAGTDLYAAGAFTNAGGTPAYRIAKWNGSSWSALGSGVNSDVNALALSGSDLYAGGLFTTADGNVANRIAKWDGSSWSPLGSGMNNWVYALALSGSDLYAGGLFTIAGGKVSAYAAKAVLVVPANAIASPFLDSGDFVARFDGTPGVTYTIEYTPNVSPVNWLKVTNLTAPNTNQGLGVGVFEFRDSSAPASRRFYRSVYPSY